MKGISELVKLKHSRCPQAAGTLSSLIVGYLFPLSARRKLEFFELVLQHVRLRRTTRLVP